MVVLHGSCNGRIRKANRFPYEITLWNFEIVNNRKRNKNTLKLLYFEIKIQLSIYVTNIKTIDTLYK